MDLSATFLDTIIKLVQLGGIGVGALIFLFVFILLVQNKPVDQPTAQLRSRFLVTGVVFATVALASSLLQLVLTPRMVTIPRQVTVTFSPSFAAAHLPVPAMHRLDTGQAVTEDSPFPVANDATLKISVDDLINSARDLKQATAAATALLETNKSLTTALATPVQPVPTPMPGSAAEGTGPVNIPAPSPFARFSPDALAKIRKSQDSIGLSLRTGDYAGAVKASNRFQATIANTPAMAGRTPG